MDVLICGVIDVQANKHINIDQAYDLFVKYLRYLLVFRTRSNGSSFSRLKHAKFLCPRDTSNIRISVIPLFAMLGLFVMEVSRLIIT